MDKTVGETLLGDLNILIFMFHGLSLPTLEIMCLTFAWPAVKMAIFVEPTETAFTIKTGTFLSIIFFF